MGQHLHDALHDEIYTVGLFAEGGFAIDSAMIDQARGLGFLSAVAPKFIPSGALWSVEQQLGQQSPRDFFLDLRHASASWTAAGASRLENNGRMPTALSADFDGAVLLHKVSGADLDFLPGWLRVSACVLGLMLARPIVTGASAFTLLAGLVYLACIWRSRTTS